MVFQTRMVSLVMRVQYVTCMGQSLWLWLQAGEAEGRWVEMTWMDRQQWQACVEVPSGVEVRYHYQLRQDDGWVMDEWGDERVLRVVEGAFYLLIDDWKSAQTVDYLYDTKVFDVLFDVPLEGGAQVRREGVNHRMRLKMAGVPKGMVPCLVGSVSEIGDWDWQRVVPMERESRSQWVSELYLPADWTIEYKYGLYELATGRMVTIEGGENRRLVPRQMHPNQVTVVSDEGYRRSQEQYYRGTGVAIPVFSLRTQRGLGVGEFSDLKAFGDWARTVGIEMIQILPINDTIKWQGWQDSYPYSAISVHALHPIYLNVEAMEIPLTDAQLMRLEQERESLNRLDHLDFERVLGLKLEVLREVYEAHWQGLGKQREVLEFMEREREWVVDYAVFCGLRDLNQTADYQAWGEWSVYQSDRVVAWFAEEGRKDAGFYVWLQYELDRQLRQAVEYLHGIGVCLKGDLPIGIDRHSVDAWASPHLFHLEAQAGAPPDAFAVKGQNWKFPTYHWEEMKKDGYAWWRSRFVRLSRYFDAFRIDHILGFFRIWQVPQEHVEGVMGWFDPVRGIEEGELNAILSDWSEERYVKPYLPIEFLVKQFGVVLDRVVGQYLHESGERYQLGQVVATQHQVMLEVERLREVGGWSEEDLVILQDGLFACVGEVLFHKQMEAGRVWYHPRFGMEQLDCYRALPEGIQVALKGLSDDYFYHRQEEFWRIKGWEKLPVMRKASRMLICGEDLGMVPKCVPQVMKDLGILSLEIERMPKDSSQMFVDLTKVGYASVVSPSTHDMNPLRAWWLEDSVVTNRYAWEKLNIAFAPSELDAVTASAIVAMHVQSPAMWAIFALQDLFATNARLAHPDPEAERINIPAIMPYNWRYRMHVTIESLLEKEMDQRILRQLLARGGMR